MSTRLIIVLVMLAGLLAGPGTLAFCPSPKAPKACCKCCAAAQKPCGMAAKTGCEIPVPQDRTAQADSKPLATPQIVAVATIRFFAPVDSFSFQSQKVAQIPSPPPLALNCIRLI